MTSSILNVRHFLFLLGPRGLTAARSCGGANRVSSGQPQRAVDGAELLCPLDDYFPKLYLPQPENVEERAVYRTELLRHNVVYRHEINFVRWVQPSS